ncbi:Antitoxin HigA [Oligella urethralis]|uniref:Uncharacterized HTH-type transcriptional regulator YddM n=1 Tax=Oligella urethralis TaxID=90245 RepID=A0A2X1UMB2_9BURK|nr:HigA family addiction module antitoxin [Oligella urethralis]WOS38091.1 Antitoxin HigA [Oligella urethralis]SPY08296.1 Uncharacterized HTH-type transcriptional regulator YddM [Oligella urethralis]SUA61325.1 Uncharacterized HTH-type transcriptional regulator YddM [Oligella urethralis]
MRMYNPPHSSLVLREYLEDITVSDAAKHLDITRASLSRILNGKTGISPLMAIKLEKALGGITAESWLAMQAKYDLWQEEQRYEDTVIPFEFA